MDNSFETVRQVVAQALMVDAATIAPDTKLLELPNIDSLSFEMIIAGLEGAAGRDIPAVELLDLKTVADLAGLI